MPRFPRQYVVKLRQLFYPCVALAVIVGSLPTPAAGNQTALTAPRLSEPRIVRVPRLRAAGALAPVPLAPVIAPSWVALGPDPIPNGQTQGRSDAISGRVTAIAIHPSNPNTIYVGTAQGGVYRSLDGGATWTPLLDSALSLAIGAIAIAPSDPTIVFVGTGEANFCFECFFGVGVYRITNADTAPVVTGPFNQDATSDDIFTGASISRILVDPGNAANIFVSSTLGYGGFANFTLPAFTPNRGVYRSTNALAVAPNFARLDVPTGSTDTDVTDMVFEPGVPNNLICAVSSSAANGGVWRSTDALSANPNFTRTLTIGGNTNVKLAIDSIGGTVTVLAATGEATASCPGEGGGGMLRRSTDGGVTWPTVLAAANGFCGGQCFYNLAVALDPANANNIYLGGQFNGTCSGSLRRSTDGGVTLPNSDTGLHVDAHAIAVAPSDSTVVYVGNDGGIWRSANSGADWTSRNTAGFSAAQFMSLALHPTDRNFMIGGTQDNGTHFMKADGSWTRADFGDGGFSLIDQNAADTTTVTMYHTYSASTNGSLGFARVTNVGNASDGNWTFLGAGGNPCASGNGITCADAIRFYPPLALGPGNPNTVYFGTDRLYRSIDQGTNNAVVSQAPLVAGQPLSAIGISPQNDNVRIVGTQNGQVFATTTGSTTLTDVTDANFPSALVSRTIIDPNDVNTAYVTFSGFGFLPGQGIWKTTNLNAATVTWAVSGIGIPDDVPVDGLVVDPNDSQMLYAGTDIGVFRSADGGATWKPFGTGLPRVAVYDIAIQNPNRILRAATHGRGVYELDLANLADLSITKTASSDTVVRGENLTYTIVVKNDGPGTAEDVTVVDVLPPELIFVSNTDSCVESPPGTLTCSLGDIPAGEMRTFTIEVTADPRLLRSSCERTFVTNTADVESVTPDPDATNNTASLTTEIIFPLNHFQCYEVDRQPFTRSGVQLEDTFRSGTAEVEQLKRFCNPADKNEEDPLAPRDACHLAGYRIAEYVPRFLRVRNQVVVNQFGTVTIEVGRPNLLLLPTAKDLATPPPSLIDPPIDHFECHQIVRGRTRVSGLSILDQFGSLRGDIKRPFRLCSPVSKNGSEVVDPNGHLLCYQIRTAPPRPIFRGPFFISNQFQDLELSVTRTREFCVPSTLNPPQ